jgi:hypothetical protein
VVGVSGLVGVDYNLQPNLQIRKTA